MRTTEHYAVIPTHDRVHLLTDALSDLLAQDIGVVRPVVVNDGSKDGTAQMLGRYGRQVSTIHLYPRSPSVSFSWNRGIEYTFSQGAPYVLVVNNDVRLRSDTYRLLVEDGGEFVTAVGVGPDSGKYPGGAPLQEAKRPHPDFSCFLIRRECWERVGPFDERFLGAYSEDWDMHVRLHKAGITAYCIDLPFLHYAAQTIKAEADGGKAVSAQAEANREYFHSKWGVRGGTEEYYKLFGHGGPE